MIEIGSARLAVRIAVEIDCTVCGATWTYIHNGPSSQQHGVIGNRVRNLACDCMPRGMTLDVIGTAIIEGRT